MSPSSHPDEQAKQAFESAIQGIYEQLMHAFADSVGTLQRLQAAGAAQSQVRHTAQDVRPDLAEHLYTSQELERIVTQRLAKNGLPSRSELEQIGRDLDDLTQTVDRRLALLCRQQIPQ